MSISTGGGDGGETSLWSGERVRKNSLRVEAYGTVDELGAYTAFAVHETGEEDLTALLREIQNKLFSVAGELASKDEKRLITVEDVDEISGLVRKYEKEADVNGFVITGQTRGAAALDLCRVVARRAERLICALDESEGAGHELIRYMNRLSDLFFIMARVEEKRSGGLKFKRDLSGD